MEELGSGMPRLGQTEEWRGSGHEGGGSEVEGSQAGQAGIGQIEKNKLIG